VKFLFSSSGKLNLAPPDSAPLCDLTSSSQGLSFPPPFSSLPSSRESQVQPVMVDQGTTPLVADFFSSFPFEFIYVLRSYRRSTVSGFSLRWPYASPSLPSSPRIFYARSAKNCTFSLSCCSFRFSATLPLGFLYRLLLMILPIFFLLRSSLVL